MNMIEKNGNCSEDLIVEKEKSLGFSLPNDYRDFLKLYKCQRVGVNGFGNNDK